MLSRYTLLKKKKINCALSGYGMLDVSIPGKYYFYIKPYDDNYLEFKFIYIYTLSIS